ncbi:hypothetical protein Desde_1386 [Desulfitobacterium dehalogenans ATCC 51507]|uniref:DUF4868 domain-containing protein n=1 Tax=Desulfitobacterium dehalogenans (strain ATCC 51507 / DSM 9161 / JW/IU-DC1) TaxID=756499 RepID=I4A775_DESDJ|nr:Kiwa anti-phage protein KwaB-like domain-containing protein [Desulfitobacterium dehalogenans]AFL99809.1 hypothetical protein Desde_1386 [Desulfitobacterium dehalogenans ATCC 51507]
MSKEFLLNTFRNVNGGSYSWNLYFLKINHRFRGNPYYVYKHTFRNATYLSDYISALLDLVIQYQIEPLESVQDYNGENSKTSCDKLDIHNDLIEEQWSELVGSVVGAPREQITGKYQGYILDGQPTAEELPQITIVKAGNPIISLDKKNSKVFKHTVNGELEQLTDELCRLYLNADFFVIADTLYSFNHSFEGMFNLEKTLHRLKMQAVESIMGTNVFQDAEKVRGFMKSYTSPKTFLTLKQQRMNKLQTSEGRIEIAERLRINTTESNDLIIVNQEQANQLIKYLCYKIFQDKETDNLIEVNSVINDNVFG